MTDQEFRAAYGGNKDALYRFAYRMTGSPASAEDIVHDCFVILWRNAAAYQTEKGTLRAFLFGVTRNLALKRLRADRKFDDLEAVTLLCEPISLEGRSRAELVAKAVGELPLLQREALILAEYEEFSLEEIAHATGAELAAVKSRLHRARVNLRRMLAPLLEEKGVACGND